MMRRLVDRIGGLIGTEIRGPGINECLTSYPHKFTIQLAFGPTMSTKEQSKSKINGASG